MTKGVRTEKMIKRCQQKTELSNGHYCDHAFNIIGPAHDILYLSHMRKLMPLIKAHADVSIKARDLNIGLSLHLHTYFVYASR